MRELCAWTGLVLLFGLAFVTVSTNVRATHRSYRLGAALRQVDDLRHVISFRRALSRHLMRASALGGVAAALGLDPAALYPAATALPPLPLPPSPWTAPLALGEP